MREPKPSDFLQASRAAAKHAGLYYCSDIETGISRHRSGKGFCYRMPNGSTIKAPETLQRIRALAIPPAWTSVWIAPDSNAHIAATGRDGRGRKQYRYNPEFVRVRDAAKFDRVISFARQLPRLRRRVARDLKRKGLVREKVLATIVRLIETTGSRIGNEGYAKENGSYGLATLRNKHVQVRGEALNFLFKGKGGKLCRFHVQSRRVAKVIRACQDLPGQKLFQYRDDDGEIRQVDSGDVNQYLREVSGQDVTAKDFRTWVGTVEAAKSLGTLASSSKRRNAKGDILAALRCAADRLGNTVAVCRKCYVHPEILSRYESGTFRWVRNPQNERLPLDSVKMKMPC